MKKPTLLISTSTYPLCSDEPSPRFVHELASRLSQYYRVVVLAPSVNSGKLVSRIDRVVIVRHRYFVKRFEILAQRNGMLENIRQSPIILFLLPFYIVSQLHYLLYLNRRLKPSAINAHWLYPQGLIAVVSRLLGIVKAPLVCTVHGGDLYSLPRLNIIKKFVINRCDSVCVVGKHMVEFIQNTLGARPLRLHWRSMGADLSDRFTPGIPPLVQKDFVFVGRMAEKKGVPVLLNAIKILSDRNVDCFLTLVGGGEQLVEMKMLAKKLTINHMLHFCGRVSHLELPSLLRGHRYFIFPSVIAKSGDQEGMPLSPVEAQGCGCVVIASDLVSTPEYVINEKTGYTFPAGDAVALADVLQRALRISPEKYQSLQEAGRASAISKYDWSAVCSFYVNEIDSLLSQTK